MRIILQAFVVITIILGCTTGTTPAQQQRDNLRGIDFVLSDWADALARISVRDTRRGVSRFKDEPLYIRLWKGHFIIDALDDPRRVESPDYERQSGSHDLSRVAGRAAYYLEEVFPITLSTITEHTSEAELKAIQQSAQQQYNAYRSGVMEVVETYDVGENTEQLADRYRDVIYTGVEPEHHAYQFFPEGAEAFKQMLHDFFPVGKTLSDLETVMGGKARAYQPELKGRESSEGVTGVFEYYYTDGMFGESYFFLVEDGIITAVNVVSRS